jgi:cell wall-associated NlpC family hydrolase
MMHWSVRYVGIPWLIGGRNVDEGLDCWGLVRYVYGCEFKITLPEYPTKGKLADCGLVMESELNGVSWVRTADPCDGDGIALGRNPREFEHVGIYINADGVPSVLHTARKASSAIQSLQYMRETGFPNIVFYRHPQRVLPKLW